MDMTGGVLPLDGGADLQESREIARKTRFTLQDDPVDIGRDHAMWPSRWSKAEKDDISAPGQCLAALDLLTGLPE